MLFFSSRTFMQVTLDTVKTLLETHEQNIF